MTHIVFLLDESGSMCSIRENIIQSVNKFIEDQKKANEDEYVGLPDPPKMTFIKFQHGYSVIFEDKLLSEVKTITEKDYIPDGTTALYDAMGRTIKKYQGQTGIIMVIVTDGLENASREFKRSEVFDMVSEQTTKYKWNFIYLSANIDTFEQGRGIGILAYDPNNPLTSGMCNTAVGYQGLANGIQVQCSTAVRNAIRTGSCNTAVGGN